MGILSILATPLGFLVELIYKVVPNYGWTLIIFTLLTKILMFPLSVKQQKSTAMMSAYQPMLQEINKKWANDKRRQQEETLKFQQETGMSMTAGCMPMALNMLVIFGLIEVVYRPLQYVLRVSSDVIQKMLEVANAAGANLTIANYTVQNELINLVKANPGAYADLLGDKLDAVTNFNFMFAGIDLSQKPQWGFAWEQVVLWIIPLLSIITMVAMQLITTKMSGQQMKGAMKIMPWFMSIFFGYFSFTVPVGFSLYYTASNVFGFVQSIVLKKIYDPEEIKQKIEAELAEKRAEKKKKKQIVVKDATGSEIVKEVSEAELARIRLAKARKLDEERYDS